MGHPGHEEAGAKPPAWRADFTTPCIAGAGRPISQGEPVTRATTVTAFRHLPDQEVQSFRILPIVTLALWPLAAFGGAYQSTAIPWSLACLVHLALVRPHLHGRLDTAWLLMLACIAVQLLPLPVAVASLLAPGGAPAGTSTARVALRPLTIDTAATARALLYAAGTFALFLAARARLEQGGLRRVVRAIVAIGCIASVVAIMQAATAGPYIYWTFRADDASLPFGPFTNRNHFATWVLMALPLCLGYATAHARAHPPRISHQRHRRDWITNTESRAVWLIASAVAMSLALVMSLSRSGMMALGVAGTITVVVVRNRLEVNGRRWLMGAILIASVTSLSLADIPRLRERLGEKAAAHINQVGAWRNAAPLLREAWLTGTGAGTYQTAPRAAARSPGRAHQTHSHYLQVVADGGLLFLVPLALACTALVRAGATALARDGTAIWWLRVGSACGLCAVALQSTAEAGLTMPANAALAAILAAILVHDRTRARVDD